MPPRKRTPAFVAGAAIAAYPWATLAAPPIGDWAAAFPPPLGLLALGLGLLLSLCAALALGGAVSSAVVDR